MVIHKGTDKPVSFPVAAELVSAGVGADACLVPQRFANAAIATLRHAIGLRAIRAD